MRQFLIVLCLAVAAFAQNGTTPTPRPTATPPPATPTATGPPKEYCQNGGQVQCLCAPNFYGDRCENAVDPCVIEVVDPDDGSTSEVPLCGAHGTCQFNNITASCICDDGWSGAYCQIPDGNLVTVSLRCKHYGYGEHNGTCTSPHYEERCLPDNLNCLSNLFGTPLCPNNIGWCLPPQAFLKISESFMQLYNKRRGPLARPVRLY